jgi:hypothetical protein
MSLTGIRTRFLPFLQRLRSTGHTITIHTKKKSTLHTSSLSFNPPPPSPLLTTLQTLGEEHLLYLVTRDRIIPHPTNIHQPDQQRSSSHPTSFTTITNPRSLFFPKPNDDGSDARLAVNINEDPIEPIQMGLDVDLPGLVGRQYGVSEPCFEPPGSKHGFAEEVSFSRVGES